MGKTLEVLVVHPQSSLALAPLALIKPDEGINPYFAGSATQAIDFVKQNRYDLILMNFKLVVTRLTEDKQIAPELSDLIQNRDYTHTDVTIHTIKAIRNNGKNQDTPIIVYARIGPEYSEIRKRAIAAGANYFHVLPLSEKPLLRKIHELAAGNKHQES